MNVRKINARESLGTIVPYPPLPGIKNPVDLSNNNRKLFWGMAIEYPLAGMNIPNIKSETVQPTVNNTTMNATFKNAWTNPSL